MWDKLNEQSSTCTKRASTRAKCGEANEQSSMFYMGEAVAAVDKPA
jgi:hypothetical protein